MTNHLTFYTTDFIKAIGQKHVSYLLASDAIVDNAIKHEINNFNHSISQRGQQFSFLICSGYFESNNVKKILHKEEFHITYSSMLDSIVCFVHYSTLQQYVSLNRAVLVSAATVFIHVPIPSILKFDKNIQVLQYHLAILGLRKKPTSDVHLLESVLSGTKAGISISFKRSCSKSHQDESLHSWLKGFVDKNGGNTMRRLFWYSSAFQPSSAAANEKRSNDVSPFLMHRKWRQWSDLEWSSYSNHSIQRDLEQVIFFIYVHVEKDEQILCIHRHCMLRNTDIVAPIFPFLKACSIIYTEPSNCQILKKFRL